VNEHLRRWAEEQVERQAELLEELAEKSAAAAELLLAEQDERQAVLEELAERQAEALAELYRLHKPGVE
jgi:hypothetical protein